MQGTTKKQPFDFARGKNVIKKKKKTFVKMANVETKK